MNIFTFFFCKILAKYSPKRTILKKISRRSMPPNPPSKIQPHFSQNILTPPPRNEILDTPLQITVLVLMVHLNFRGGGVEYMSNPPPP